ncbi:MAG: serine/threonine-protein kinase [Vicinamibacterales bacterium]
MTFAITIADAQAQFPDYTFVKALTPSAQKAAFHVRDEDGHDLCLKIVAPTYERDRLDREILAMQAVNHPNVVQLREYTFSSRPGQQRHFIIEEFVDGSDLADRLKPGQPWAIQDAVQFFAQLCDGLAALRKKEIVHRDIKPQNIRVRPDGAPVIIDFGLARHLGLPDLTKTLQGARIGTPAYFAPEQFDGNKHDIDHRTDLFAVGILLYEATTGERPFIDSTVHTVAQLRDAVCDRDDHLKRPAFLGLNAKLQILIAKLLEKQRAKRPAEPAQVAEILRKIGAGVTA